MACKTVVRHADYSLLRTRRDRVYLRAPDGIDGMNHWTLVRINTTQLLLHQGLATSRSRPALMKNNDAIGLMNMNSKPRDRQCIVPEQAQRNNNNNNNNNNNKNNNITRPTGDIDYFCSCPQQDRFAGVALQIDLGHVQYSAAHCPCNPTHALHWTCSVVFLPFWY